MDILTSGYGELEVESFVKFFVEVALSNKKLLPRSGDRYCVLLIL